MHEQHTVLMQPNLAGFIVKVTIHAFPRRISFTSGRRKIIHGSPPKDSIANAPLFALTFVKANGSLSIGKLPVRKCLEITN
jgi:hypothetical protein